MKLRLTWLFVALLASCLPTLATAQSAAHKCPIVIDQVELSYNHQGGQSKPQLTSKFVNDTKKQVLTITFSLLVLDSSEAPRPYPDDLTYSEKLDPGQKKVFTWDLSSESIDMHRTGESLILEKVEFTDDTLWRDDGSESCADTVDFHAK
jgi:hypothetical protein